MGGNQSEYEEDDDRQDTKKIHENHAEWLKTEAGKKFTEDAKKKEYKDNEWMRKIQEEHPSIRKSTIGFTTGEKD